MDVITKYNMMISMLKVADRKIVPFGKLGSLFPPVFSLNAKLS